MLDENVLLKSFFHINYVLFFNCISMKFLLIYKQINFNEELKTQYLLRIKNKIKLSKCLNNKVQGNKPPTYNDFFDIST